MPDVFLSRQPLINRQNKILANRLSLHLLRGATTQDAVATLQSKSKKKKQGKKKKNEIK